MILFRGATILRARSAQTSEAHDEGVSTPRRSRNAPLTSGRKNNLLVGPSTGNSRFINRFSTSRFRTPALDALPTPTYAWNFMKTGRFLRSSTVPAGAVATSADARRAAGAARSARRDASACFCSTARRSSATASRRTLDDRVVFSMPTSASSDRAAAAPRQPRRRTASTGTGRRGTQRRRVRRAMCRRWPRPITRS